MQLIRCVPPDTGPYRYFLDMRLAAEDARGPRLAVILKNPSTASATRSDPTIGKLAAWARRNGYASLAVVNLFARRATHPTALNALPYDEIVGAENDAHIRAAITTADTLIAGWGNPNGLAPDRYARRLAEVACLLAPFPLHIVGHLTRQGHPRHALLWNGSLVLTRWR